MSDASYNANDIEFLLSRSLDEPLSETDRKTLGQFLAADPRLEREANDLRRADALLKRWAAQPTQFDEASWHAEVMARVNEAAEERAAGLVGVDHVLSRWAQSSPRYDEAAFADSVLREVRRARAVPFWQRSVSRAGLPAAIAASILLALALPWWMSNGVKPSAVVRFGGMVAQSSVVDPAAAVNVVIFRTEPSGDAADCAESPGVAYLSVGSEPMPDASEEVPPI